MTIPVIDADAHINEPADLWTSRLPSKYADLGPRVVPNEQGHETWVMNGRTLSMVGTNALAGWSDFPNSHPKTMADTLPASYDAEARLQYLDEAAIWAQVLYPNVAGFGSQGFLATQDEKLKLLCVEAYNNFLVEWCAADPVRLVGIMAVPFWDIDAAVAEIERCAELGIRGALFTGEPQRFDLPPLGHAHWDPFYAALQAAGMPAHFHLGGGEPEAVFQREGRSILAERTRAHGRAGTAAYQMVELCLKNAIQCGDLITSGVLPRFPDLKFVSVESGAGWLPFMLESADWSYQLASRPQAERFAPRTDGQLLPSELFARQVYTTYWFEYNAPTHLIDALPLDNIMFETDFPHSSCLYGDIQETIERSLGNTPEEVRRKFLWENAANLYGIPDAPESWLVGARARATNPTPSGWGDDWDDRKRGKDCALCGSLAGNWIVIGRGLGTVVYTDRRAVPGYCVVMWDGRHVAEPTELSADEAVAFWRDVVAAGRAVERVFEPVKMNYFVLGNAVPHLHAQVVPRYADDPMPGRPITFDRVFGADTGDASGDEEWSAKTELMRVAFAEQLDA